MSPGSKGHQPISLTGIVLCGGSGRRMGTDKALLQVRGRPLWRLVSDKLATVCDPVLLARGTMPDLGQDDYPVVEDAAEDSGPLGGIVAGLRASPHPNAAVIGVDLPNLSPSLIRFLAGQIGAHDVCVPLSTRGPEPLHAVYSTSALGPLEIDLLNARLGLMEVLGDLDTVYVSDREWPIEVDIGFAENLNHPSDVQSLRGRTIP